MSKKQDELVQLHGNLYWVPFDLIGLSDDTDKSFFNPRWAVNLAGGMDAAGMSDEEMAELRESIQKEGLQHPLILRADGKSLGNKKMLLLGGERRYRCIEQLIQEDAPCFDHTTGKKDVPASTVYAMVECRILTDIDDKVAYQMAFAGNDRAIGIGERAAVLMVRQWRKAGYTDDDIKEIVGKKSPTWLRDTDSICSLDKQCFDAFIEGAINRTVAIRLSEEQSLKQRLAKLNETRRLAKERIEKLIAKAEAGVEKAEDLADAAEATVAVLVNDGAPSDAIREAQERHEQTKANAKRKKKNLHNIRNRKAVGGKKDFSGAEAGLSMNKIRKHHIAPLDDIIKEHPELADKARFMKHWWSGVAEGNLDILDILQSAE